MINTASDDAYSLRPAWLLCEGTDCRIFFERVLEKLGLHNIYCFNVKGVNDVDSFKKTAKQTNYNNFCEVIVYVRDAERPANEVADVFGETHLSSVISMIKSRFMSIGLAVGDKPFELTDNGEKKAGYIVLTDSSGRVGTLEDLCLDIAVDAEAVEDADLTIKSVNEKRDNKVSKHMHKRKLHIAFALNEKEGMIGARTGQAVTFEGLDLDHERFAPIREFLELMSNQN